jgi:exodeoxyribonuclease-3
MRIATWNVNSIRQRMENMQTWLAERSPDIVCLQEIKCQDEAFPREVFEGLGYNVAVHGQKTFNGVALLSKLPFDEVAHGLIGDTSDVQARFLEAVVSTKTGVLRVVSLYLPNGNPPASDKYSYKLKWMDRLIAFSHERLKLEEPLLLAGDFNVIPAPADARNPAAWTGDALFLPQTREKFRALTNLGLTDGRRVDEGQRHPHRPSAAVAAGGRPAGGCRYRPARARLGQAVRSCPGLCRSGYRGTLTLSRAASRASGADRRRRARARPRSPAAWRFRKDW